MDNRCNSSTSCRPLRAWLALLALLVLLPGAAAPAPAADRRVALVIGNADYAQAPLKNPQNDARDIAAKLRQAGFDVVLRENLKIREIGSALREFRARLSPGSEALFFYAGHGLQVKGINYLPAVDADIRTEEDLPFQSLNVNQVLEIMDESRTRLNLVFLDACRNNPYSRRFRSAADGLARVHAPSGTLISFATRPGSVAADGEGRNGVFTEHLLKQMEQPNVPIESVMKRVVSGVKQATAGAQEPWLEGSIEGEFYFFAAAPATTSAVAATAAAPPAAPPAAAPSPPPVMRDTAEDALWLAIEREPRIGDYQIYLRSYPQGRYAVLARARIAELQQAEAAQIQEKATWSEAERLQSEKAYQDYLKRYPEGLFAPLAAARIERLKAEVASGSARQQEIAAWESARKSRSAPMVLAFIDRFPASEFAPPARALLAELQALTGVPTGVPFRDCQVCPELVIVPPGSFEMGDPEAGGGFVPFMKSAEGPVRTVTIAQPFAIGRFEVTFAEWDACVADKACSHSPPDHGWGRERRPVVGVSWADAQQFVAWLARKTGHPYRLPSEAEWEYAARAGAATAHPWGIELGRNLANCKGCGSEWDNQRSAPVGSFAANAFGLHDVLGNATEWVEDCYVGSYEGAPADGSARLADSCSSRVLRGGALYDRPRNVNVFRRFSDKPGGRSMWYGFRVARPLVAADTARRRR
jgi:formylglycine-generating enzyme required for sulfatase activity